MPSDLVIDPVRIRRLRAALDEVGYDRLQRALRGSHPRVPHPPYEEFAATLRRVDPTLRTWFELLLLGRSVSAGEARRSLGAALDDLIHLRVVKATGDRIRSRGLGLSCYLDRYVLARLDPLYPTAPREAPDVYIGPSSYRLAAELPVGRRFGRVLDLCTGSGLLGILMAPSASQVIATDLIDDAVAAARFNVLLNGVEDRLEVRQGDLFAPVRGERFDLVVFNAPFVAYPPGVKMPVLSGGGADGLTILRPLLAELRSRLTRDGWGLAYFESEGDRSGPVLARRLAPLAKAGKLDVELTLVDRTSVATRLRQLRVVYARTREPLPAAWVPFYREQGANLYYAMVARFRAGLGQVSIVNAMPRLSLG